MVQFQVSQRLTGIAPLEPLAERQKYFVFYITPCRILTNKTR